MTAPLILASNTISGEFEIANSLRFDDGSSDYLNRTSGTADSTRKFTISCWLKIGNISTYKSFFSSATTNPPFIDFSIQNDDEIQLDVRLASGTYQPETTRKFRDVSAWYHVVVSVDTTQATESNRLKLYINGTQETTSAVGIPQNSDLPLSSVTYQIGRRAVASDSYFDGYMAEYVFIDGSQLDPTSFGEFDEDTGIWKPIDVSGLTFGTNGFYLDFENSGSLGNDKSGNGNNFTVNNLTSIDQTTDTPTNNFATLNALSTPASLSEGNLKVAYAGSGSYATASSTIGVTQGKWYCEVKLTVASNYPSTGICATNSSHATTLLQTDWLGKDADTYGIYTNSGQVFNNGSVVNTFGAISTGDIIGMALDLDSAQNTLKYYKNGSLIGTQNITTNSNGWLFAITTNSIGTNIGEINFGSPAFSISSGNSDGNGYGLFEYPPSGYLALCTKNLATDG